MKLEYGPDALAKARYLSVVEEVAGADSLPSDIDEFLRTESLDTHKSLAEFWTSVEENGGIKEGLAAMRELSKSSIKSPRADLREVERANAGFDPDPGGSDASIIEAMKHDPSEAVHATDDQLIQAISELWEDGQRTQARRIMFANSHRLNQERQNAILNNDNLDDALRPNAARERYDERNPREPDAAEARRRNARNANESSPGVTSVMETAPGSIQDRAAEEKARERVAGKGSGGPGSRRENATDADDVDMSLAPSAAKERFEERQRAKYDD